MGHTMAEQDWFGLKTERLAACEHCMLQAAAVQGIQGLLPVHRTRNFTTTSTQLRRAQITDPQFTLLSALVMAKTKGWYMKCSKQELVNFIKNRTGEDLDPKQAKGMLAKRLLDIGRAPPGVFDFLGLAQEL